jgi:hypothetical protein
MFLDEKRWFLTKNFKASFHTMAGPTTGQRRYGMKGRSQMQGGKSWILPKETN